MSWKPNAKMGDGGKVNANHDWLMVATKVKSTVID